VLLNHVLGVSVSINKYLSLGLQKAAPRKTKKAYEEVEEEVPMAVNIDASEFRNSEVVKVHSSPAKVNCVMSGTKQHI
jgi:hypothetical protein